MRSSDFLFCLSLSFFSWTVSAADKKADFPFQPQSLQFRFQQGFFDVGTELLEDILKQVGFVDAQNTVRFKAGQNEQMLQYKKFRSRLQLQEDRFLAHIDIDILQSRFFVESGNECTISLKGPLSFDVIAEIYPTGSAHVQLDDRTYNAGNLDISTKNCSLGMRIGISLFVKSKLQESIQEGFYSVFNKQELQAVTRPAVDQALQKANIFVNVPAIGPLSPQTVRNNFAVNMGIQGYLSNAKGENSVSISNPRQSYINEMGFQWSLGAGFEPVSKSIYSTRPMVFTPVKAVSFPEWGLGYYQKTGQALDFDAGLMIKESFISSLFNSLYQAGFFNIQMQDSLLRSSLISLNPLKRADFLKVILPNGQPLTVDNYEDARLEMIFVDPPTMSLRENRKIFLSVPDFQMTYWVKAKGWPEEFQVLRFRAKFNLVATIHFDATGRLSFTFNEMPIQEFIVLAREGLGQEVTDQNLESQLNADVVGVLKDIGVTLPFVGSRKLKIPYMSVDSRAQSPESNSLALYLKAE